MALGAMPSTFSVTCKWVAPVPLWPSPSFFSHYFSFLWVGVHNSPFYRNTSRVRLLLLSRSVVSKSVTSCIAAPHASQSFTIFWSLLKVMSTELMMPSNHLILCYPLLLLPSIFSNIRVFLVSQLFASGGQSIGASASASVLPMNIPGCFP